MQSRAKALVQLKFKDKKQLTTLLDALKPEVDASVTRRANVSLEAQGAFLVLSVDAADTVSLRATLNAYLRWIGSTVNVIELIKEA